MSVIFKRIPWSENDYSRCQEDHSDSAVCGALAFQYVSQAAENQFNSHMAGSITWPPTGRTSAAD